MTQVIGLALIMALGVTVVPAAAAPPSAASIAAAQAQAAAARAKLAQMRSKLDSGLSEYNSAAADLAKTRADIAENTKKLAAVKASLAAGQVSLDSQASFLYRTDGTGFVDVLLGSATFDEFASRLSVLQQIASKDAGLVESLKSDRAEAVGISALLADRESHQRAQVDKVTTQRASVQGEIDQEQAYLSSLSAQVQSMVAAQEKAANPPPSDTSSNSTPAPVKTSGKAAKPINSSGSKIALKLATVTGRSGSYWVMAKEASSYSPSGVKFSGNASEYGTNDNGTGTASGHPLNDQELTCAHPSLPFGTRIAVTHAGRRIIVVVTDRGPYSGGRVIDLTHRGAKLLGIDGVGEVKCEVVDPN
ncbi:MAG: RlpA-like double-psi beta-barrel domain-containing protein [Coriobacteriia bacterium]|nr:RlpA-like double-psi beta-barrel domain-containing protein [Coriobacteriia bacterium]